MTAGRRICVFAGSSPGAHPSYAQAAVHLAEALVSGGFGIVYGGAKRGLMGVLADAALSAGGTVMGVIPEALVRKEVAHQGLTELHVVRSMHERKAVMADLAVGFLALPGGLGTLEELFEVFTWTQLGIHAKPCGLMNVQGYYDPLLAFLEGAVRERFLRAVHRDMLLVESDPARLVRALEQFEAPVVEKWLDRSER